MLWSSLAWSAFLLWTFQCHDRVGRDIVRCAQRLQWLHWQPRHFRELFERRKVGGKFNSRSGSLSYDDRLQHRYQTHCNIPTY
jgi:hypothetical protein